MKFVIWLKFQFENSPTQSNCSKKTLSKTSSLLDATKLDGRAVGKRSQIAKKTKRLLRMIISLILSYCFCWLPYHAWTLLVMGFIHFALVFEFWRFQIKDDIWSSIKCGRPSLPEVSVNGYIQSTQYVYGCIGKDCEISSAIQFPILTTQLRKLSQSNLVQLTQYSTCLWARTAEKGGVTLFTAFDTADQLAQPNKRR